MKNEFKFALVIVSTALAVSGCKEQAVEQEVTAVDMQAETSGAISMPEVEQPAEMPAMEQPAEMPEVVVTVNGEELRREDVQRQMQQVMGSPQFASLPPEQAQMALQQVQGQIVSQFVDQTLLREAAEAADIAVTDEEVEKYLEELRSYFAEGEGLEARMAAQGISMDDLREDIVADMKIRSLLENMTDAVEKAGEEELKEYYEENKEQFQVPASVSARHILIQVEKDADDETKTSARQDLADIRAKIVAGDMTFEEAAKEHSSCPSSARGGDLGQFSRGQMVPPFEEAAFAQPIGEVGEIVETDFGYHLILVENREEGGEQTFADVQDDIAEQLSMGAKQEMVRTYLEGLRAEAKIEFAE